MNHEHDDELDLSVYIMLLSLTGLTVALSRLGAGGRIVAVATALLVASAKAGLIGFYYMGLRRERALTLTIVLVGLAAVASLALGILPDVGLYPK